ncbi:MAG: ATP-binding protein [Actinobacteria bacterium]|nr:ATP-binding protein [Actinomycetota bacterium]
MKRRDIYLNQLIAAKDQPVIKVITGIRRCGKSSLLELYYEYLMASGVPADHIVKISFESLQFEDLKTYQTLYKHIASQIQGVKTSYILLDEIQEVDGWERAINSLVVDYGADVYITGSNASLLSSELATLLTGRYIEIRMLPLSFAEYLDFIECSDERDYKTAFSRYMNYGGLPAVALLISGQEGIVHALLQGIYTNIVMKDVVQRNQIRDVTLLEAISHYLADTVGSPVSSTKISNYLTSSGRKASTNTIDNYIRMLEDAFIVYRARRYDLQGKLYLKTQEKYYQADTGLRNEMLHFAHADYGHLLENIVYLELLRRGYEVGIGKVGTLEVDFVAQNNEEKIYIQVAASVVEESVLEREVAPLRAIDDNYRKVLITADEDLNLDYSGIKQINIIDYLLALH